MATDKFDYARLLNDIDAKMASLQTLRASVLVASASGALGQPIEGIEGVPQVLAAGRNDSFGVPTDLPEGAFMGKSVPACVELYLSAVKKKKTNKEIAAALREGGVESNASNFETVVTGALFGLKKAGRVLRFKDGWGLAEWYPPHIRGAADSGSGRRTKKKGKRNGRKNTGDKSPAVALGQPAKIKTSDRIIELLRSKPEREYSPEEIAKHIETGVQVARLILGTLRKGGKVRMSAPDMYVIGRPQLVAAGA